MTEEKKQSLQSTSRLLCEAYNTLLQNGEVSFEIQDEHADKLDTIVKTIEGTWFGFSHYPTIQDRAAAYMCFIIKDHPMTDGNKRLSVLFLEIYCKTNNLTIDIPKTLTLDQLAVSIENEKTMTIKNLSNLVKIILFEIHEPMS